MASTQRNIQHFDGEENPGKLILLWHDWVLAHVENVCETCLSAIIYPWCFSVNSLVKVAGRKVV